MNGCVVGMLAETFVHPGSGQTIGAIDLPVAREAATDYPFIAGSSLKGAFRDSFERGKHRDRAEQMFGSPEAAGEILISDARLALLPVRSLSAAYLWITCPLIVERFNRDLRRSNYPAGENELNVPSGSILAETKGPVVFLEERSFKVAGGVPDAVKQALAGLIPHKETAARVTSQMAVLSDDDFAWFARYGLVVQARNALDDDTKLSNALWYEESLPPDTVMYCVAAGRVDGALSAFAEAIGTIPYLQTGGNETIGQGWFALNKYTVK